MWSYIRAFETKLRLWEIQLGNANYAHFATLQQNKPMSTTLFVSVIRHFGTEFSSRFSNICSRKNNIRLFSTPFDIQVNAVPEKDQMELIELQCSNELKSQFQCEHVSLLDSHKKYLDSKRYTNLVKHTKKMASYFSGAYACEQLLLSIKLTTTKLRAQFADEHLQDVMFLSSSKSSPELQKHSNKNHQISR